MVRPIVFLPLTALTGLSELQLQVVNRPRISPHQAPGFFRQRISGGRETLLFYHPAVWWLNKRIRLERENCCDDTAIALCGNPVEYARALTLMEQWRVAPPLGDGSKSGSAVSTYHPVAWNQQSAFRYSRHWAHGERLCFNRGPVCRNAIFGIAHQSQCSDSRDTARSTDAR